MCIRTALIEKFTHKQSDLRAVAVSLFPEDDMLDFLRGLGLYVGEFGPQVCICHADVIVKFVMRLIYLNDPAKALANLPEDLRYLPDDAVILIDQMVDWFLASQTTPSSTS